MLNRPVVKFSCLVEACGPVSEQMQPQIPAFLLLKIVLLIILERISMLWLSSVRCRMCFVLGVWVAVCQRSLVWRFV